MDLLKRSSVWVWLLATVLVVLRLFYIEFGAINLAPDEAQYWDFSRHLDWSYYSKPPLVPWLIHVSTSVWGNTEVGVRFFAVIFISLLSALSFFIAKKIKNEKAGWLAFVTVNVTPMFAAGGMMMTPDVPCLLLWVLALYTVIHVDWQNPPPSKLYTRFIFLGIILGLAGLAKYSAALFYPLLGLFLLVDKKRRVWLFRPEVYVAGVISILMVMPVIYWNYIHDWVGLKHVMGQAGNAWSEPLKTVGNFLGGQLGLFGFMFLFMLWVLVSPLWKKQTINPVLWWFSAPVFLMFLVKSLDGKVQPNWPVLSTFVLLLMAVIWVVDQKKYIKLVCGVFLIISMCVTVVGHDTFILRKMGVGIPMKKDPLKPVYGWKGLGQAVSLVSSRVSDPVFFTGRYQTASSMAFYMMNQPEVHYINPGHNRQNQYDYWPWPDKLEGRTVIYIQENMPMPPSVFKQFKSCGLLEKVGSERDGVLLKMAYVYVCGGFAGERYMAETY